MKLVIPILFLSQFVLGQSNHYENFSLNFYSIGYGSNMHTAQPVFKITQNQFVYTNENAWTDSNNFFTEINDTICKGTFRSTSIDSIIALLEPIKDTLISKSNPEIMSGGSDFLIVNFNGYQTKFELNNAFDPSLFKIVEILNTYIHEEDKRIGVFEKEIKTGYNTK